jgi:hypothetical protein
MMRSVHRNWRCEYWGQVMRGDGTDLEASKGQRDGTRHHVERIGGFVDMMSSKKVLSVDAT